MIADNMLEMPEAVRHAAVLADYMRRANIALPEARTSTNDDARPTPRMDVVTWGEQFFYIPTDDDVKRRIQFLPHQKTIMRLFFDESIAHEMGCRPNFQTLVFSTIKKSGKTALAALIARWICETWGSHAEVYSLANDLEQARGRIYAAALASIELDPRYQRSVKGIPGLWRIIERQASYLPTHSTLRAVSSDYKGEAGSNPVATFWSELWGYSSEASLRLWEELTPVPTRPRSIRYVETYAGYEGESGILNELEDKLKNVDISYRLTRADLDRFGLEWPFDDPDNELPFYVHPTSRTVAYWDSGVRARRMPWQTPEYYAAQRSDLRTNAYLRLHENIRSSPVDNFIPIEWWDRLATTVPPLDKHTPVVVGADASVSGDYTAIVAVTRDPANSDDVLLRDVMVWQPYQGRPLDYGNTIEPALRDWCSRYNVVEIAYDQYQLHDLMTRLRNEGVAWCKTFNQQGDRLVADKALFDCIRDQRIHHNGCEPMRLAIKSCGAKIPADDNTRLRLVKKADKSNIDPAVALSMAVHECKRLML